MWVGFGEPEGAYCAPRRILTRRLWPPARQFVRTLWHRRNNVRQPGGDWISI